MKWFLRKKNISLLVTLMTVVIYLITEVFFLTTEMSPELVMPLPSLTPVTQVVSPAAVLGLATSSAIVSKVVDGDTIKLSSGETVRYIGIDTPETKDPRRPVGCFGLEASQKNADLVLGKTVFMEKDVSETDRYGRLLRYVYLDGIMINELLVKEGYAVASDFPPDIKYSLQFHLSQAAAEQQLRGLWGEICANAQ